MKICDLKPEEVKVGLRLKSLKSKKLGVIIEIDKKDDDYAWIKWDNEEEVYSGFYGNQCNCELI